MFNKLKENWKIAKGRVLLKRVLKEKEAIIKDEEKTRKTIIDLIKEEKNTVSLEGEDGRTISTEEIEQMNKEDLKEVLEAIVTALKEQIGEK